MEDPSMTEPSTQDQPAIQARSNSVKQLCDLYGVVVSIAVGLAFHNVANANARPLPLHFERLILFGALIFTITPFFHGAVRHLYATYIEVGGSTRVKNWVVLIDYYLLLLGGGLFVVLASCLGDARAFGITFAAILFSDIVWGVLSEVGFGGTQAQKAEVSWAKINAITVVVVLVFLIFQKALNATGFDENDFKWFLLLVAVVRTSVDYYKNHSFYCPRG